MIETLKEKQKLVLYVTVITLFLLGIFYMFFARPLFAEEKQKEAELQKIETAVSDYETLLAKLEPQRLTEQEKVRLLEGIPVRPNVEQVIKLLEQTEKGAGVKIENLSFAITPNEIKENRKVNEVEVNQWGHIFPDDIYLILAEKIKEVKNVRVSYVDVQIAVNGPEANMNKFIKNLENLPRIVHVQSYNYTRDGSSLKGTLAARIFYSEDFAPFTDLVVKPKTDKPADKVAKDAPPEPKAEDNEPKEPQTEEKVKRYDTDITLENASLPSQEKNGDVVYNTDLKEGGNGFYLVQTGAYTSDYYLYRQVDNILAKGFDPRVSDSSISLVFTSVTSDIPSAMEKAKAINQVGVDTYIMPLQVEFSKAEIEWLRPVSQKVLSDVASVTTKGVTDSGFQLTNEHYNQVVDSVAAYEVEVKKKLTDVDEKRKAQLNNTLDILNQVKSNLASYQEKKDVQKLWTVDGLLIDFTFNLNGNVVNNN